MQEHIISCVRTFHESRGYPEIVLEDRQIRRRQEVLEDLATFRFVRFCEWRDDEQGFLSHGKDSDAFSLSVFVEPQPEECKQHDDKPHNNAPTIPEFGGARWMLKAKVWCGSRVAEKRCMKGIHAEHRLNSEAWSLPICLLSLVRGRRCKSSLEWQRTCS